MRQMILVIDDQWSMQEYARLVLQTAGYRVLLASDTLTGLSLARTVLPDAIIMDARMGGITLLQTLREDKHTAAIPMILITLYPQEDELSSWPGAGTSSTLQKPFQPPALLTMIERLVGSAEMPIAV